MTWTNILKASLGAKVNLIINEADDPYQSQWVLYWGMGKEAYPNAMLDEIWSKYEEVKDKENPSDLLAVTSDEDTRKIIDAFLAGADKINWRGTVGSDTPPQKLLKYKELRDYLKEKLGNI